MANAIVNPWIFYLMPVCSNLKLLAITISVIGWAAIGTLFIIYYIDSAPFDIKLIKAALLPMIIATILAIFIPSENTLMQMTVASYVTPENVNNAYQIVLDVTNDLLGIVGK